MFSGKRFEEALRAAERYEEEQAKQGDAVRIRPYKNGGETNIFRDGLKVLFPKPAKPYKNGGGFWDNLGDAIKETYVPLPKDYSPILMKDGGDAQNMWKAFMEQENKDNDEGVAPLYKDGGQVPHNMIKHSSPLAMNEHGLFQHDLYNAVQQTGFGIKSYIKYV